MEFIKPLHNPTSAFKPLPTVFDKKPTSPKTKSSTEDKTNRVAEKLFTGVSEGSPSPPKK